MQAQVAAFLDQYQLHSNVQTRHCDVISEIGELAKEILKSTDYGKQEYCPTDGATDEMGDCLFSLLALCQEMGIDAEAALQQTLAKYEARFQQRSDIGSGR